MDQKPYPADKARGGEIILNTPARRAIFLAGLIGAVILGDSDDRSLIVDRDSHITTLGKDRNDHPAPMLAIIALMEKTRCRDLVFCGRQAFHSR